jgi:hypothetical protein
MVMKRTYKTTIEFENKYHRDLFESWMSNIGEQEFDRQLEVEKENQRLFGSGQDHCPKSLLDTGLIFRYPKKGMIKTEAIFEEEI